MVVVVVLVVVGESVDVGVEVCKSATASCPHPVTTRLTVTSHTANATLGGTTL